MVKWNRKYAWNHRISYNFIYIFLFFRVFAHTHPCTHSHHNHITLFSRYTHAHGNMLLYTFVMIFIKRFETNFVHRFFNMFQSFSLATALNCREKCSCCSWKNEMFEWVNMQHICVVRGGGGEMNHSFMHSLKSIHIMIVPIQQRVCVFAHFEINLKFASKNNFYCITIVNET